MTGQIHDSVIFEGEYYSIIRQTEELIFHPVLFGLDPEMISTACYRGYYATFAIVCDIMLLKKFTLRTKGHIYPVINGIEPEILDWRDRLAPRPDIKWEDMPGIEHATYKNLDVEMNFTGQILLGRKFIDKCYVHMGFQSPESYEEVLKVTLDEGWVTQIKNESRINTEIRRRLEKISTSINYGDIYNSFKRSRKYRS